MNQSSTTADAILACTRRLIVAGGYNGFSYADIADVAGVRKASIHAHFPSKADLVTALVSRYREAAEEAIADLGCSIPEPLEQLRAYIRYWETCIGDASAPFCICALLAGELPLLADGVALEVRAYFRFLSGWLAAVLERGVQEGALKLAHAPRVEAEAFMAIVHGAMLSARAYGDAQTFGAIMWPQLERFAARKVND